MSNVLVTGGAGFIGANFVHYWLEQYPGDRVVVLDALTYAGNMASLAPASGNPAYRFVKGDICDSSMVGALLEEEDIDTIVHFAAESHVDRSISGPGAFIQTNMVGTYALLEAARAYWLGGDANARAPFPSRLDGRGVRVTGRRRPRVQRTDGVRAKFPVLGEQGGFRSPGTRLSPHLRDAGNDEQLLE